MTTPEALTIALSLLDDRKGRGSYRTKAGVLYSAGELHQAASLLIDLLRADVEEAETEDSPFAVGLLVQDEYTHLTGESS